MRLIFNGDDFGLTSGINQGIIRSFKEGLLSSASLVAGGEAGREAISFARDNLDLDIGVHLVLSDEPSVLPHWNLSSIMSSPRAFPSRNRILKAVIFGSIDYREVEAEWCAQVEQVLKAGIRVSHLDSHQFVHLFPGLVHVGFKIARKYDIPFVRGSSDDPASLSTGLKRFVQWTGLTVWTRCFISRSAPPPVRIIPSVGFLAAGGGLKRGTLLNTLERLRSRKSPGVVEIMLHPGTGDVHTSKKYRRWGYHWRQDLDLLRDRSLRRELAFRDMTPTSFREVL